MKQRRLTGRGWRRLAATLVVSGLVLTACSGSSDDGAADDVDATEGATEGATATEGDVATEGDAVAAGECTLDAVTAQVDGLEGEEREAALLEIAADESGEVTFYGSIGEEDIAPVIEAFEEKYGLTVGTFSASSEEILQRVAQEEQVGRAGADVVDNNGTELILMTRDGMLAEFDSPYADDLIEGLENPTWLGTRFNVFTILYNSDRVSVDEVPRTYEDLADPRWDGVMGVDAGNWDLMAGIVRDMEADGMSEEEAIGVWEQILDDVLVYNSNTPLAEGVQAGELDLAITYNHYWSRFTGREAESPIEWQPAIQPQVLRPNGIAIPCSAGNPASGLLFLEYLVSFDGQTLLGETAGRDVAHTEVEAGMLPQADEELRLVILDLEDIIDNSEFWSSTYETLISGGTVVGG